MREITNNELTKRIYLEEDFIVNVLRQQEKALMVVITVLRVVAVVKRIFIVCFLLLYLVSPCVNLGVSVWRLIRRDYGDAGGDTANRAKLTAALDIFYALMLFQSLFAFYYVVIQLTKFGMTKNQCELEFSLSSEVVIMYYIETKRKFKKDGKLPDNWNFIAYGVELLQSASGSDHLWGARVLDTLLLVDKHDNRFVVREKLLSSRVSIQNLIGMIDVRGTADNIESRERAAKIVAHLATDVKITHFSGTLECICSLLSENRDERRLADEKEQHGADTVLRIKDPAEDAFKPGGPEEMISQGLLILERLTQDEENCTEISKHQRLLSKITSPRHISQGLQILERLTQDEENCIEISKHQRLLSKITSPPHISQGLQILERLTQDEENCIEISKHQRLLPKITSPLSSHDLLNNVQDTMVVEMLSKSLTVVSRLLTSPGDGATRLRQELASNTEAVSNLMGILETTDSEGAQELHGQALEILTELAFDDSFTKLASGESTCKLNKLFETLRCIFIEDKDGDNDTTAEEPGCNTNDIILEEQDRERATRLRGKAGEALARLLPLHTARDANVADDLLSKQDAIDLWTKVLNQILSSEMGTTHRNEKHSDKKEFMAGIMSLAVAICNENVVSREDFARATPEDAALVKKLKEVLKVNRHRTAECLRIVNLTCQVVIAMIQVKPSSIQHLNEHNFKEALTEALETMSEVDGYMLFARNDLEVIKPARSLTSLVKKAQELLETA